MVACPRCDGMNLSCEFCDGRGHVLSSQAREYRRQFNVDELIRHDESRTDEKLLHAIAAADAEADRDDGREPGDTRDEESLEDHNIQGLGAFRDVFDAGGEQ
jgi:hypothetical protein